MKDHRERIRRHIVYASIVNILRIWSLVTEEAVSLYKSWIKYTFSLS